MSSSFRSFTKIGSLFLSTALAFGGLTTAFFLPTPAFAANPVRVYVAGESIERRNCFLHAPFTSSGALNLPSDDNDDEYGWMIPMAERLKIRQPGLGVQFVGTQPWATAEDYDYNPTNCAFMATPGRTSAISGSSVDSWIEDRSAELTARTYCYDVAFASRGGNDGASSHEEYRNQLKDLVRRLAHGSSCQTNPIVYVTGHMPDNQGSVSSLRARFSADPRQVVDELHASDPALNVRFIDIFSAFASNQPTTAFPRPAWLSSSDAFNIARIGRDGDGLHPRRLSSIYAGEVVADAININEFMWGASSSGSSSSGSGTTVTPPPVAPTPAPTPTPTPVAPPVTTPVVPPVATTPSAAATVIGRYDIGQPILRDIWVDPTNGRDSNSGSDRAHALASLAAAVRLIPTGHTLTGTGYRLMLTRGEYTEAAMPNYWEDYIGTAQFPIIIQAADGKGTAMMRKDINAKNIHYFYLIDLNFERAEDLLHFEQADHVLLRGLFLRATAAHETLKVNQSKYMYIEDSDISGADDNAIDFVAVQYGHIVGNKIHNANDWCMYTKGGSASIRIEGNEIYDCGVGGYTAGQGTGFQYMVAPWIYYEASDIKFVNNVIHDTGTSGLGVNGGYNILMAYNTLYRVGTGHKGNHSDHVFEANFGGQGCDNTDERALCATNRTAGGWGTTTFDLEVPIPNKNVYLYNNIFVNPAGTTAPYLLQVASPRDSVAGTGLTGTLRADENLQIKGNVIADSSDDLGLGESTGCAASNPTCNPTQLRRDNQFIHVGPGFVNAASADFRLISPTAFAPVTIPAFPGGDRPASSFPAGELSNGITTDRAGNTRGTNNSIGAYVVGAASATPAISPSATPTSPDQTTPPAPPVEPGQRPDPSSTPAAVVGGDVAVALFATPYPTITLGSTISYRVTVSNRGTGVIADASVSVALPSSARVVSARSTQGRCDTSDSTSGAVICHVGRLAVGQSVVATLVYRPTQIGVLHVTALAMNLSKEEEERGLANDHAENTVTVIAPQVNLYASVMNVKQSCRGAGATRRCTITGKVTIKNSGTKASTAMRTNIVYATPSVGGEKLLRTLTVPAIASGRTKVYALSQTLPRGQQAAFVSVIVDAAKQVNESNENDNRVDVKLP